MPGAPGLAFETGDGTRNPLNLFQDEDSGRNISPITARQLKSRTSFQTQDEGTPVSDIVPNQMWVPPVSRIWRPGMEPATP